MELPLIAFGSETVNTQATEPDWRRAAISHAVLAPSAHNAQPWRFRLGADRIDLFADLTRRQPVADPDDRELTISCGAALACLELSMLHLGLQPRTTLLPDPADPSHLAAVQADGPGSLTPDERELYAEIPRRHTNRGVFPNTLIPSGLMQRLMQEAATEGAWLEIVSSELRHRFAELIAEGDEALWADPAYRRELAQWIHAADKGDGLTADYRHGLGPLVVRALNLGRNRAEHDAEQAEHAPLMAVLGTSEDAPRAWLMAGRALARVLLRASASGLDASFLNQPIEVPALRKRVAHAIDRKTALPQMIIRLGVGENVEPSPRRPLDAVLID